MCTEEVTEGHGWEMSLSGLPCPHSGSQSPQVTLTFSRSASCLGPKARNLQVIFNCQESDAKSISAQDGPLWPHSYLKVLDDKIVQNTEHIKEIITGIIGMQRVRYPTCHCTAGPLSGVLCAWCPWDQSQAGCPAEVGDAVSHTVSPDCGMDLLDPTWDQGRHRLYDLLTPPVAPHSTAIPPPCSRGQQQEPQQP